MAAPEAFLKDDVRCKPELDGLGALGDLVRPICLSTYLCNPFPVQAVIPPNSPHAHFDRACAGGAKTEAWQQQTTPCSRLLCLLPCCTGALPCAQPYVAVGLRRLLTADAAAPAGLVLHAGIAVGIQL